MTMTLIETKTLLSAAASLEFTSIPQDGTDLLLLTSIRSDRDSGSYDLYKIQLNGSNEITSGRILEGNGSSAASESRIEVGVQPISLNTSNTFNNGSHYIPNYTSSAAKSFSGDSVSEQNGTKAGQLLTAGLWNNTSPITSLKVVSGVGNLIAGSTISLYGILKGSDGIVTTS